MLSDRLTNAAKVRPVKGGEYPNRMACKNWNIRPSIGVDS